MSRVRTSATPVTVRWAVTRLVPARLVPALLATAVLAALLTGALLTGPAAALPVALAQPAPAATVDEGPAPADATVTWGVRPGDVDPHAAGRANFAYTAAPGETIEDALVVSNHGGAETALRVYVADAFTTTRGALDLLRPDETSTGVGAWTAVATPDVVVPPGGSVVVPFTLTVPDDAEPGDHAGGVVTSLVSTNTDGVSVDRRLGARLHLRVDGPLVPGARLEGLSAVHHGTPNPAGTGDVDVDVEVVNTGNVRVGGPATVTVVGPFGWGEQVAQVDVPELLPGERATVQVQVDDVLPLLRLTTTVRFVPQVAVDGSTLAPVTASASTLAVPWTVLGLLVLVVAVACAARVRARRRSAATDRLVAEAVAAARAEAQTVAVP